MSESVVSSHALTHFSTEHLESVDGAAAVRVEEVKDLLDLRGLRAPANIKGDHAGHRARACASAGTPHTTPAAKFLRVEPGRRRRLARSKPAAGSAPRFNNLGRTRPLWRQPSAHAPGPRGGPATPSRHAASPFKPPSARSRPGVLDLALRHVKPHQIRVVWPAMPSKYYYDVRFFVCDFGSSRALHPRHAYAPGPRRALSCGPRTGPAAACRAAGAGAARRCGPRSARRGSSRR